MISGILNIINVVRYYILGDEKFFPDTNMPDMGPFILYSIHLCLSFAKLINYIPIHNQPCCVPHLRN